MIPEEAYTADLSHYEFRLLAVLCHMAGQEGAVEATVAELGTRTRGASDKTVRRALEALEEAGLISRARLRGAAGRYSLTRYTVHHRSPMTDGLPVTHDRSEQTNRAVATSSTSSNLYQVDEHTMGNTSYFLNPDGIRVKRVKVMMKNYDTGDDIGGFGLLEPKVEPTSVKKNDPKTRWKRPQHEWTSADVAAEFSYLVGKKFPWLPGTVNVRSLAGALAKYRNQYQTTPLLELELLKIFMADDRNFEGVGAEAPSLYKKYLASFGKKMNQARENLGMPTLGAEPVVAPAAPVPLLVASDGRTFQNNISGRAMLKRHEERISK